MATNKYILFFVIGYNFRKHFPYSFGILLIYIYFVEKGGSFVHISYTAALRGGNIEILKIIKFGFFRDSCFGFMNFDFFLRLFVVRC